MRDHQPRPHVSDDARGQDQGFNGIVVFGKSEVDDAVAQFGERLDPGCVGDEANVEVGDKFG